MAAISWPSVLADVLVSGATIRGRGLQAWWSMNTVQELPDNVAGTTWTRNNNFTASDIASGTGGPGATNYAWANITDWDNTGLSVNNGILQLTKTVSQGGLFRINIDARNKNRIMKIKPPANCTLSYNNDGTIVTKSLIANIYNTVNIRFDGTGSAITDIENFPVGITYISMDYIGSGLYDTKLADNSGNGNLGTMTAVTPVTGKSSNGLLFNGVNSNIILQKYIELNGIGTISFWHSGIIGNIASSVLLSRDGVSSSFLFDQFGVSTSLQFTDSSAINMAANLILRDGLLHHYVITFGSFGYIFYRDKIIISNGITDYSMKSFIFNKIGSYLGTSLALNGSLDEIRAYNRILSSEEVVYLYNNPTTYEALPEYPDYDGFGEVPQNGTIRSSIDSGPPKVRRRFTALTTIYNVQYQLTQNQKQLLDYFYRTTTAQGSLPFNFEVPDGNTVEARFLTPPSFSAQEQGAIASFQIEVLP